MSHREHNSKLANAAAEWVMELEDNDGPEMRAAFLAWLSTSPVHMQEFLLAISAYKTLNEATALDAVDIEMLTQQAAVNVVRLPGSENTLSSAAAPGSTAVRYVPRRLPKRAVAGIAAVAVLAIAVSLTWRSMHERMTPLTTAIGEQRTFKLEDGSVIYLNARSKVAVSYSSSARKIQLIDGEALFVVARDTHRPFIVGAGAATVQAVGTQFNVYRKDNATTVSVVEGRVKVLQENTLLDAGQEATVARGNHVVKQRAPDVSKAIAWRQRRLVFRADSLPYIIEQFSRYNVLRIQLEGEAVKQRALTGIFNADEPAALVNFLRQDPALEIREANGVVSIRSRSGAALN